MRLLLGPALLALVALPWFVAIERAVPGAAAYFLLNQNLEALMQAGIHHGAPWYAALPLAGAGFARWSPLLLLLGIPAAASFVRRSPRKLSGATGLLLCWCAAPLLVFTLSVSKLATYYLPMYPALARLTARLLADDSSGRRCSREGQGWSPRGRSAGSASRGWLRSRCCRHRRRLERRARDAIARGRGKPLRRPAPR
jgi:4-amino-4-deoxy-L-arabinose transferase-like glycosyltransferase